MAEAEEQRRPTIRNKRDVLNPLVAWWRGYEYGMKMALAFASGMPDFQPNEEAG